MRDSGFRGLGLGLFNPLVMENQMEKKMENEMESWGIEGL